MIKTNMFYKLTLLLLIIFPVNYMVFNVLLLTVPYIQYIKDIIIILIFLLFLASISTNEHSIRIKKNDSIMFGIIICIIILIFFRTLISSNVADSLYAARLYIMPLLLICIYSQKNISIPHLKTILMIIFHFSVVLAIWGIFQAYVLGDTFLIELNYKGDSGRLTTGFYISGYRGIQRVTSTFAAPNLYAMYANFIFFIYWGVRDIFKIKQLYWIEMAIILISSILTFSRSAWLGLFLGFFIIIIRKKRFTKKQILSFLFTILGITFFCYIIIRCNSNIREAFYLLLSRTFDGTDASLESHNNSFSNAIELISENLGGYEWLGYSGPRTRTGVINYNVESSLLLLGLDLGVLGGLLYIALFLYFFKRARVSSYRAGISSSIISIIPSLMLLPLIEEFELISFIFIFIIIISNFQSLRET